MKAEAEEGKEAYKTAERQQEDSWSRKTATQTTGSGRKRGRYKCMKKSRGREDGLKHYLVGGTLMLHNVAVHLPHQSA